jgi:hypothetical protein
LLSRKQQCVEAVVTRPLRSLRGFLVDIETLRRESRN